MPSRRIDGLIGQLGGEEGPELRFGALPVSAIAATVGTPFYAYSGDAIIRRARDVRAALGADTDLYYSVKANPSLGVSQLLAHEGVGAEVASIGELRLAERAGFRVDRILFAGPGKTDAELAAALRLGIRLVNVESPGELARLAAVAEGAGRVASVGLRVNPRAAVPGARMRMGGGSLQFGMDEEQVPAVLDRFGKHPFLDIAGLHVYAGTQMFDVDAILESFRSVAALALSIADGLGRPLRMVDFGGGFGVPYFEGSPEFDLSAFGTGFRRLTAEWRRDSRLAEAGFVIELGRYLVAHAGVYVTRVVDVKESRGKRFVVTDGGMNHHITATGNFGQVFRKPYPVAALTRLDAPPTSPWDVVGPCCTPLDVLGHGLPLPETIEVGDLLGVFYSGAYGYSASSLHFLSHPTPAEVLVLGGRAHVLRRTGAPDAVLDGQIAMDLDDLGSP